MAKTRRLMQENLKLVDLVIELRDARIPYSSKNPEIEKLVGDMPRLILLNKASLADPAVSRAWLHAFEAKGEHCLLVDCVTGQGLRDIYPTVCELLADKLARWADKGMNKKIRAMIVGIPNVGKSSFINRIAGSKKAKVENRPGVTLNKQWVSSDIGLELLDMPGVLWPKFEEKRVGENLALTGAIKDKIMDTEEGYVILDVREQDEYDAGHIPGAILIPYTQIDAKANEMLPDKDRLILVYCRSGRRSKIAAEALAELGYTNIKEFGGIIDWPYEVEKP